MRFIVSGSDKDTGLPLELTFEAVDVSTAARLASQKGILVTGVRQVGEESPPPILSNRTAAATATLPIDQSSPASPDKPKHRLWLGFFFLFTACIAPPFPGFALGIGLTLAAAIIFYIYVPQLRPVLGYLLRVSPDQQTRRKIKLATFGFVSFILVCLSANGYAQKHEKAEFAAKQAADEEARRQAVEAANLQALGQIEKAKLALAASDVNSAQQFLNVVSKINLATNRGPAKGLQAVINESTDSAAALNLLLQLSDKDFDSFKTGGNPPASFDLGYTILTDSFVAIAKSQLETAVVKRAEAKKINEDKLEAKRLADAAQAAERQKAADAKAAALKKVADDKAAAAAAERARFEKGMGETLHVGYTSYSVWEAHWSDILSTNQYLNKRPNAKWLFLNVTVRNDDIKARQIPPFTLIDEQGREYESSAEGTMVDGAIGILDSLNPNVSKQGYVIFDVPQNQTYKLKLSGGYWSTETGYIRIVPKAN